MDTPYFDLYFHLYRISPGQNENQWSDQNSIARYINDASGNLVSFCAASFNRSSGPPKRPVYNSEIADTINADGFEFSRKEVFYSAKACAVAAIAFFLIVFYGTPKWLKAALLLWIILITFNRIYIGAYYPSALFVSVILGAGIGLYAYRYYHYLKKSVFII